MSSADEIGGGWAPFGREDLVAERPEPIRDAWLERLRDPSPPSLPAQNPRVAVDPEVARADRLGQVIAGSDDPGADLAVGGEMADDRRASSSRIDLGGEEGRVQVSRLWHGAMKSIDLSPLEPRTIGIRLFPARHSSSYLVKRRRA